MPRGYSYSWRDTVALAVVSVALAVFSAYLASKIPLAVLRLDDNFFGSDINRVVGHMTNPAAQQSRLWVHPLFLIMFLPLGLGLLELSFSDLQACLILVAASASATGAFLYLTCRNLGLAIRHSLLIVAVFASSSTFMFWWSIPETFPFAGAGLAYLYLLASQPLPERRGWTKLDITGLAAFSLLSAAAIFVKGFPSGFETAGIAVLLLLVVTVRTVPHTLSWFIASLLAIGITLSNWTAALIATFVCRRFRDFLVLSSLTFLAASWLAIAQNKWSIEAPIFFYSLKPSKDSGVQSELGPRKHLNVDTLQHITFFTMVSPLPVPRVERQANKLVVASPPVRKVISGPDGWMHGIWLVLLALGLFSATLAREHRAFGLSLAGFIGFNWVLHSQYGDDTFLYATHFLVPLTLVAALAMTNKWRDIVAVLCAVFVVASFSVNISRFLQTAETFQSFYSATSGSEQQFNQAPPA
jgi:hypothetical protein